MKDLQKQKNVIKERKKKNFTDKLFNEDSTENEVGLLYITVGKNLLTDSLQMSDGEEFIQLSRSNRYFKIILKNELVFQLPLIVEFESIHYKYACIINKIDEDKGDVTFQSLRCSHDLKTDFV